MKTVETFFIIPQVASIAHCSNVDTRASEAQLSTADNRDANPWFDIAKDCWVGALPFVTKLACYLFEGIDCLRSQETINWNHKGNKGSALFMAFLLILALFLIFRSNEALFRVLSLVGSSIQVLDVDVKDAVHAVGVEASHKKISMVTRRNIDHSWTRNARRGGSVRRARGCCSGWWLREGKFNQ
jgi:hypothetical protein